MNDPNIQKALEQYLGHTCAQIAIANLPLDSDITLQPERRVLIVIIPTLEVRVDGLPTPYVLKKFEAWASPAIHARRVYFDAFGSPCLVEKVGESTKDTKLTTGSVRRDRVVTMFCRPIWTQLLAAERIMNFVARRGLLNTQGSPTTTRRTPLLPHITPGLSVTPPLSITSKQRMVNRMATTCSGHRKPRAVLMFGFPGSGKNHIIKKRPHIDHILIDVDLCLEKIPAYWQSLASGGKDDWVYDLRAEAHTIATTLLDATINRRSHLIWNGTGRSYEFYSELITRLRSLDYVVELCGVHARSSTARLRMKARARPVPKNVLVDSMCSVSSNFMRLVNSSDHARIWTNNATMGTAEPHLIWDKHHGVLDTNAWRAWECPSPLPLSPRPIECCTRWDTTRCATLPPIITDQRPRSGTL